MTSILQRCRLHTRSEREYPVFVENPGLNYVDGGVEVDTATVWIDGRTIFRRTFGFGAMPTLFATVDVPHGITSAFTTVRLFGTATTTFAGGQGTTIMIGFNIGPVVLTSDQTNISILTLPDLSIFDDSYVTIDYVYGQPI